MTMVREQVEKMTSALLALGNGISVGFGSKNLTYSLYFVDKHMSLTSSIADCPDSGDTHSKALIGITPRRQYMTLAVMIIS